MGTIMTILIILSFLSMVMNHYVPVEMREKEYNHMNVAITQFSNLKMMVDTDMLVESEDRDIDSMSAMSVPITMGAEGIPVFSGSTKGELTIDPDKSNFTIEFSYSIIPPSSSLKTYNQDAVLIIDSSGSMRWNDPGDERLDAAANYVDNLVYPDRVAIVDFDSRAYLTRRNIGEEEHHIFAGGHNGMPDYECAKDDLDTIDSYGGTNFGWALELANDELINHGNPDHVWVEILLTDGQNNYWRNDTQAINEAHRAKYNNITIFTIGLGNANFYMLQQIADITGGIYYPALNPSYLDWIYEEISKKLTDVKGSAVMNLSASAGGDIELSVPNRYYVPQDVVYENGAVIIKQNDGEVIREAPDFSIWKEDGGTIASFKFVTIIGRKDSRVGAGSESLQIKLLSHDADDFAIRALCANLIGCVGMKRQTVSDIQWDVWMKSWYGYSYWYAAYKLYYKLYYVLREIDDVIRELNENEKLNASAEALDVMNKLNQTIDLVTYYKNIGWIRPSYADELINDLNSVRGWFVELSVWLRGVTISITTEYVDAWSTWLADLLERSGIQDYTLTKSEDSIRLHLHSVTSIHLEHVVALVDFGS